MNNERKEIQDEHQPIRWNKCSTRFNWKWKNEKVQKTLKLRNEFLLFVPVLFQFLFVFLFLICSCMFIFCALIRILHLGTLRCKPQRCEPFLEATGNPQMWVRPLRCWKRLWVCHSNGAERRSPSSQPTRLSDHSQSTALWVSSSQRIPTPLGSILVGTPQCEVHSVSTGSSREECWQLVGPKQPSCHFSVPMNRTIWPARSQNIWLRWFCAVRPPFCRCHFRSFGWSVWRFQPFPPHPRTSLCTEANPFE